MKVKIEAIVKFISEYNRRYGYSPSIRDIAKQFKISVSTAYEYLVSLKRDNLLTFRKGHSRTIRIISSEGEPSFSIPVLGEVRAGQPVWSEENLLEYLAIPYIGSNEKEIYVLKVTGDSMQGIGIFEGDSVLVRKQSYAQENDIVVAIVDSEVTLKRLIKKENKFYLKAENPSYPLMEVTEETKIIGKVIQLIRKYE